MNELQKADIRLWYRCLYRSALRAVQYSIPARFVVRDQLRAAFRTDGAVLSKEVAQRTNWFLHAAAKERGLEHKVLKNLVRIAYERNKQRQWRAAYIKDSSQQGKPLWVLVSQVIAVLFLTWFLGCKLLKHSMPRPTTTST